MNPIINLRQNRLLRPRKLSSMPSHNVPPMPTSTGLITFTTVITASFVRRTNVGRSRGKLDFHCATASYLARHCSFPASPTVSHAHSLPKMVR